MKKICFIALFFSALFISTLVFAEPASQKSIVTLMEKTGAGDMGIQMMNLMLPSFKKNMPDVPEKFWTDIMSEIDANQIIELVIPVYQKHLSEDEIQAIITFYDTPEGKKFIKVQPVIMQESYVIGQQWGKKIAMQIVEKYKTQTAK